MIPITPVMSRDVITVDPVTPVYEAMRKLRDNKISGMPVVNEDNELVGILTEKDVLGILLSQERTIHDKVGDLMTREVTYFDESADAVDICKFFMQSHIRRVPICKDGVLIGIVSRRDIMELILEADNSLSLNYRFN